MLEAPPHQLCLFLALRVPELPWAAVVGPTRAVATDSLLVAAVHLQQQKNSGIQVCQA
jgi:hypothetical protein